MRLYTTGRRERTLSKMSSTTRRDIVSWAQVPGTVDVSMSGMGVNFGTVLRIFVGAMALAAPMMAAIAGRA